MEQHIARYNSEHAHTRCFVVSYDDFNPFLDQFREHVGHRYRRPEKLLAQYELWDHMDAILSLAISKLCDGVFKTRSKKAEEQSSASDIPEDFRQRLNRHQRRDLLLLAACYDQSPAAPHMPRWKRLQQRLHGWRIESWWPFLVGCAVSIAVITVLAAFAQRGDWGRMQDYAWAFLTVLIAGWLPWLWRSISRFLLARGIVKQIRVIQRDAYQLSRILMHFSRQDLSEQPLPNKDRTDDRYRLLAKLQSLLESLDFSGIVVLVDRVDEPHLINGSADAMKAMLWPMLDNKFLKQPGLGIKFLLPIELAQFIDREDRDFYQRARLDKQNLVPSLNWTGQALYDLANSRIAACSARQPAARLIHLLQEDFSDQHLFGALQSLRVPRHVFRFLYRAIMAHCNRFSDDTPVWRISSDTFEAELAVFRRELDAADRGLSIRLSRSSPVNNIITRLDGITRSQETLSRHRRPVIGRMVGLRNVTMVCPSAGVKDESRAFRLADRLRSEWRLWQTTVNFGIIQSTRPPGHPSDRSRSRPAHRTSTLQIRARRRGASCGQSKSVTRTLPSGCLPQKLKPPLARRACGYAPGGVQLRNSTWVRSDTWTKVKART